MEGISLLKEMVPSFCPAAEDFLTVFSFFPQEERAVSPGSFLFLCCPSGFPSFFLPMKEAMIIPFFLFFFSVVERAHRVSPFLALTRGAPPYEAGSLLPPAKQRETFRLLNGPPLSFLSRRQVKGSWSRVDRERLPFWSVACL